MSAEDCLNHPWLRKSKASRPMDVTKDNLKHFVDRWNEHPNSPYIFDAISPDLRANLLSNSLYSLNGLSPSPCGSLCSSVCSENVFLDSMEVGDETMNGYVNGLTVESKGGDDFAKKKRYVNGLTVDSRMNVAGNLGNGVNFAGNGFDNEMSILNNCEKVIDANESRLGLNGAGVENELKLVDKYKDVRSNDVKSNDVKTTEAKIKDIKFKDVKSMDVKAIDVNDKDVMSIDVKPLDVKSTDFKSMDVKSIDVNAKDILSKDVKSIDVKSVDVKSRDIESEEIKSVDVQSKDTRSIDVKSVDIKSKDVKSVDIKSKDVMSKDRQSKDVTSIDVKSKDVTSIDVKSKDVKSMDVKSKDVKSIDVKSKDVKAIDVKSKDVKSKDVKSKDVTSIDVKSKDVKSLDVKSGDVRGDVQSRSLQKRFVDKINEETKTQQVTQNKTSKFDSTEPTQIEKFEIPPSDDLQFVDHIRRASDSSYIVKGGDTSEQMALVEEIKRLSEKLHQLSNLADNASEVRSDTGFSEQFHEETKTIDNGNERTEIKFQSTTSSQESSFGPSFRRSFSQNSKNVVQNFNHNGFCRQNTLSSNSFVSNSFVSNSSVSNSFVSKSSSTSRSSKFVNSSKCHLSNNNQSLDEGQKTSSKVEPAGNKSKLSDTATKPFDKTDRNQFERSGQNQFDRTGQNQFDRIGQNRFDRTGQSQFDKNDQPESTVPWRRTKNRITANSRDVPLAPKKQKNRPDSPSGTKDLLLRLLGRWECPQSASRPNTRTGSISSDFSEFETFGQKTLSSIDSFFQSRAGNAKKMETFQKS